ncbi:MAG: magnesium transporter CorA family protein [Dehalococcoidales bacterium]|nr:magnesium transporter CorA family protein [Dehalococcoidales bacterium]
MFVQPTRREIEYLAQNYPFHALDLDDCLSRIQRAKIDEYADYLFLILPYSRWDKKARVSTHKQISTFIGAKYLITIHSGELKPLTKLFRACQIEEEARQENLQYGSGYLLYRILDRTVDAYFPILDAILNWVDDVEDVVFDENIEAAQEVATLRRDIITQRRILLPWRSIITELEPKLKRFTTRDISVHFGDLIDHLHKICDSLDDAKEIIEIYKDSDYILSADRLNRVTRVLTIMSSIILPFLVISSIYGMNIALPGGLERGSFYTFLMLVSGMGLISAGMLYFFRRKRWI